jgi:tetratricopeptide (TPR) repeat protein
VIMPEKSEHKNGTMKDVKKNPSRVTRAKRTRQPDLSQSPSRDGESAAQPIVHELRLGADRSRNAYKNEEAIALYAKAFETARREDKGILPNLEYDLLAGLTECHWRLGEWFPPPGGFNRKAEIAQASADVAKQVYVFTQHVETLLPPGQTAEARRFAEQALGLARSLRNARLEADGLRALGRVCENLGDSKRAARLATQALELYPRVHDRVGEAGALTRLASAESNLGQADTAHELGLEALAISREEGDRFLEALAVGNLSLSTNDFARVRSYLEESLALHLSLLSGKRVATAYNNLALIYEKLGLYRKAREYGDARDLHMRGRHGESCRSPRIAHQGYRRNNAD